MKFSALYETYEGFRTPTFTLTANGTTLAVGHGAKLVSMECRLTTLRDAGSLVICVHLHTQSDLGSTWLDALQLGAVCTLSLGYVGTEKEVFSGFVYDAIWDAPLHGDYTHLEVICLDVRGQLMLSAHADADSSRSLSQLIQTTLEQSCCTRMASPVLGSLPQEWDLPIQRAGRTDYEVLCQTADFLCYEFFTFAHQVYFQPARSSSDIAVTFDGCNGLMQLRHRRTLAGQCAAVSVSGADDQGERLYARQPRSSEKGYGMGQADAALTQEIHQAEPALHTMAQATYLAQARMELRQHQSGLLMGQCTGIPDFQPGQWVEVTGLDAAVNGLYYIQTVVHTVDETGFETYFEAQD